MSKLKTILAAAVVAGAAALGASQASAMPMAPVSGAASAEQVRFGCGPGWRPNAYGRCVPAGPRFVRPMRPRPYYGRPHRGPRW